MMDNNISTLDSGHAFMQRALHLSTLGGPRVSPNPFVGSVIVADGRIIGEGYHRRYGEGHAEVNAVASVKESDLELLRESTMYVTLEPCSHFGKTPPCADLIIRKEIPKVVIAAPDPFLKNYDSGIERLRKAGVQVDVGLMRKEAEWINRRFFTAHTLHRPFILLKWAQSANGCVARKDGSPVKLSNHFTSLLMHRERSRYDAIMVGVNTILNDNPRLNCRLWPCRDSDHRPRKTTFESPRLKGDSLLEKGSHITKEPDESLPDFLRCLYEDFGITSLMVEGGPKTAQSFIDSGLFDEIRIETSPAFIEGGIPAPRYMEKAREEGFTSLPPSFYDGNTIEYWIPESRLSAALSLPDLLP